MPVATPTTAASVAVGLSRDCRPADHLPDPPVPTRPAWAAAKHGGRGRRGWRKLHLGVDQSGVILRARVLLRRPRAELARGSVRGAPVGATAGHSGPAPDGRARRLSAGREAPRPGRAHGQGGRRRGVGAAAPRLAQCQVRTGLAAQSARLCVPAHRGAARVRADHGRCVVDHWKNSSQRHRWLATALVDIEPRLRKVMGYRHLPKLREALQRELKIERKTPKTQAA